MSEQELTAIETRAIQATPGPWETTGTALNPRRNTVRPAHWRHRFTAVGFSLDADADFVAHAREDVPLLVAEVRRLRAALDAATAEATR